MIHSLYGQLANSGGLSDPLVQAAAAALAAQSTDPFLTGGGESYLIFSSKFNEKEC